MNDREAIVGRMRICEVIAKDYPFSAQEVYDIYEYIREHRKIVVLSKLMFETNCVLQFSVDMGLQPLNVVSRLFYE